MADTAYQKICTMLTKKGTNLAFLYHIAVFLISLFVATLDIVMVEKAKPKWMIKFGGRWRYLTIWNLDIQLFYFAMCVVNDALQKGPANTIFSVQANFKRQKFLSAAFASLVFPLALFVAGTFWGLYYVDRDLVFPKYMDAYVPPWINHCMHTFVVVYVLLELCLIQHVYPSVRSGLMISTVFCIIYFSWVHFLYYASGSWPYPILEKLQGGYKYFFMLGATVAVYPLYLLGNWLHHLRWGWPGSPSLPRKLSEA